MRLTCPNCDAQYEVDDRAIPDAGRDVQCSNCGHTWFQLAPHVEEAMEDEAATFGDGAPKPAALPEPPAAAPSAPTLPREPPPIIPAPAPAPVQPVAPVVPVAAPPT